MKNMKIEEIADELNDKLFRLVESIDGFPVKGSRLSDMCEGWVSRILSEAADVDYIDVLSYFKDGVPITSSRKSIKSDYSDEEYWYPTPETKKVYRVERLNPRTGQGYGHFDFDTREEAEDFKRTQGRNTATYHVYITEREVPLNSSSKKKSIKSSAENKKLPTHAFVDAFVDKLNAYCDKEFGDTDPEFTKKYGKLYDFKYRSMNKMLNDGWGNEYDGIVIYDDQGSLDWFEDEFLPKWINEELGKSGFYAEPIGSSRFVIAVE